MIHAPGASVLHAARAGIAAAYGAAFTLQGLSIREWPVVVGGGAALGFLGAWLGGYVFERTGSYDWLWYIDIMLAVGAALIHMPIKEAPKLRPAFAI